ncbi:MAG TPA: hypothetical protein VJ784_14150 [Pyrinomonadaceae bacterium]|nr:hypothetical protein [Pyrinomonadaceae bacterium]
MGVRAGVDVAEGDTDATTDGVAVTLALGVGLGVEIDTDVETGLGGSDANSEACDLDPLPKRQLPQHAKQNVSIKEAAIPSIFRQ